MSASHVLRRIFITLAGAIIGLAAGVYFPALRITGKPQEFRSLAKVLIGGQTVVSDSNDWREQQQDLYGTIIETLESVEMKRRALERVRALNPDLHDCDVDIRVAQTKGSAIFNVLATGPEPKYTKIFLDALLDEFIAFRQNIREQAQGKVLQQFLQEVVARQKAMEQSLTMLENVRAKVDTLSVKSDQERLVTRLNTLRDQRDDLRLELKPMDAKDAARAPLEAKLSATEQGIRDVEAELQRHEPGISARRAITEKYEADKQAYERLFEQAENVQTAFNSSTDYVAIQERATPAAENVEDWVLPIAVGAIGGGLLGGLIGLVLSLLLVSSPKS